MRCFLFLLSLLSTHAHAADIIVRDTAVLRAAVQKLKDGDTLKIAPGEYPGGHSVRGITGLTVEAMDSTQPPRFVGGKTGWQFSRCEGLNLRHLIISGQTENGLNLDDGGQRMQPVKGIRLLNIEVRDIGPTGNHDGIKCSGLTGLEIDRCKVVGWGGQGIDFVGCHHAIITGCVFEGKPGFSASAAIQLKGGTCHVKVSNCQFKNAGSRPLNVGGSNGLDYFRPPDAGHEAKAITIQDCLIEGSQCAAAFVGVDGAVFERNTILFPEKWIFRILQETTGEHFAPCRNVTIKDNRIVFRRAQVQVDFNIGSSTAPETFSFQRNRWFAEDQPGRSQPKLPSEETGGTYGQDPRL